MGGKYRSSPSLYVPRTLGQYSKGVSSSLNVNASGTLSFEGKPKVRGCSRGAFRLAFHSSSSLCCSGLVGGRSVEAFLDLDNRRRFRKDLTQPSPNWVKGMHRVLEMYFRPMRANNFESIAAPWWRINLRVALTSSSSFLLMVSPLLGQPDKP